MNNVQKSKSGFTIIEVVLVLAIAGLIFLIVFLAVPALQRSQRDTQRRSDVGRAAAALQQYQSNSRGNLPTAVALTGGTFTTSYLTNGGSSFADPTTGATYAFANGGTGTGAYPTPATGTISFRTNATCDPAGGTTFAAGGGRNIALVILMESGGAYCQSL